MMDVETANSTAAKGGSGLPRIFAAASTFVSCLALAGVFLLVLQNQKLQAQMDGLQQAPQTSDRRQNDAQKEIARREVHDMIQSHLRAGRATATSTSYICPHERTHSFYKDCTDSPRTPGSMPSAHIVPDSSKSLCYVEDPGVKYYSNITVGWSCGLTIPMPFPGYVSGGMVFNRTTGELIVPVKGVYFIYSQVHMEVTNTSNMVCAGTQTIICPQQGSCRPTISMLSEVLTDLTSEPFYHGGLFRLIANSTIRIAAFGRVNDTHVSSLAYKTYFGNTFMGAFLVQEIEESPGRGRS